MHNGATKLQLLRLSLSGAVGRKMLARTAAHLRIRFASNLQRTFALLDRGTYKKGERLDSIIDREREVIEEAAACAL